MIVDRDCPIQPNGVDPARVQAGEVVSDEAVHGPLLTEQPVAARRGHVAPPLEIVPLHLQGERLAAQRRAAQSPPPRRVHVPQQPPDLAGAITHCFSMSDEVYNLVNVTVLLGNLLCTVAPLFAAAFVSWSSCSGPILVRYHDELLNYRSRERYTWSATLLTAKVNHFRPFVSVANTTRTSSIDACPPLGGVSVAMFVLIFVALAVGTTGIILAIIYSLRRFHSERSRRVLLARHAADPREQSAVAARYPPIAGTAVVVGRSLILLACIFLTMGITIWLTTFVLVRCDERSLVPYDMCSLDSGLTWTIVALIAYAIMFLALWMRRGWLSLRSQLPPADAIY